LRRNLFFDTLNKVLVGAALLFIFLLRSAYGYIIAGMCLMLAIVRMLSRDYQARQRENDIFTNFFNRQKAKANAKRATKVRRIRPVYEGKAGESTVRAKKEKAPKSDGTHRVFKCPKCKQPLRVPRGKGKILITCQNCGNKFQKKT
jgi:ribosomal protein L37AE/L43A